jgi:hypothetical protein
MARAGSSAPQPLNGAGAEREPPMGREGIACSSVSVRSNTPRPRCDATIRQLPFAARVFPANS